MRRLHLVGAVGMRALLRTDVEVTTKTTGKK